MLYLAVLLFASELVSLAAANPPKMTPPPPTPAAPAPAPAPEGEDCPGCIEWEPLDYPNGTEFGNCCFGDKSLGSDYTRARCPYVWLELDKSCDEHHPCCFEYENGKCTFERCFDCVTKGGSMVHDCKQCEDKGTTTDPWTSTTESTPRPPATLPPHSDQTTGTVPERQGCCCIEGANPQVLGPHECHECDGVYQGDGVSCDEPGVCRANCCVVGQRDCVECPHYPDPATYEFVGFGPECPAEACGVTCCLNGHAIDADSTDQCEWAGGVAFPDVPLDQADCGGGCCVDLNFTVTPSELRCDELGGRWLGQNQGYYPGACGGACCSAGECIIANSTECAELEGVYQGDDVPCQADDDDDPWGVCQNDGCCCLPKDGGSVLVANSRECYKLGGVFQGEGSECSDDDEACDCGVCCADDEFGGRVVQNEAECELRDGRYAGDGSRLDMPGVCDAHGGACICGDQCLDVPDALTCKKLHGDSFRGVGTSCKDESLEPVPENPYDEGSCCVPRSFHNDHPMCVMLPTRKRCEFVGGTWNGFGSKCEDDTCKDIRGACCTRDESADSYEPVYKCMDDMTLEQCRECDGHWGGAESLCSDEYSCAPAHRGACCRDAHSCSMATVTACRRVGGRFQGFNTTCSDLDSQICKHCAPAEADAPQCDDYTPCENPHATCVKEYGKCMVIAAPIASEFNYTVEPDPTTTTYAPEPTATTTPTPRKRSLPMSSSYTAPPTTEPPSTPAPPTPITMAEPTPAPTTTKPKPTAPPTADDYAGPLSCGPDNSTIGLPCLAAPLLGKCRIGVCMALPEGHFFAGDECGAVCRHIKEYPCGCEGEGEWLKKCAAISGRVIDDVDHDHEYDEYTDAGLAQALVELYKFDDVGGYDYVAEQHSGVGGHYAFSELAPGKYKVRVTLPGCYAHSDGSNHRIVTLNCVEAAHAALRASPRAAQVAHSFALEHREKGAHLAKHIDFLAYEDCDAANDQQDGQSTDGDIGDAYDDDDDDGGSGGGGSGGGLGGLGIALILGGFACVLLVVAAIVQFGSGNRRRRRRRRRRD